MGTRSIQKILNRWKIQRMQRDPLSSISPPPDMDNSDENYGPRAIRVYRARGQRNLKVMGITATCSECSEPAARWFKVSGRPGFGYIYLCDEHA